MDVSIQTRLTYKGPWLLFAAVVFMFVLLPQSAAAQTTWNATNWTLYDTITIDAANIDDEITDFPVYVDLADLSAQFWNTTPTGATVGTDIRVTTNDGTPVELARELVAASSTAQTGELHFKANSISSTTDTVFRIYYNGTTTGDYVTNATYGAENVWSNDFVFVQHMNEDPGVAGVGEILDSTAGNHDGTDSGLMSSANAVTGKIGAAINFDGNDDIITMATSSAIEGLEVITLSSWIYPTATAPPFWGRIISKSNGGTSEDYGLFLDGSNQIVCRIRNTADTIVSAKSGATLAINTWHYATCVYDGSTVTLYVNGVQSGTPLAQTGTIKDTNQPLTVGDQFGGTDDRAFEGRIDSPKISSTTRSVEWMAAEYTNQNIPTAFYTSAAVTNTTITAATATDPLPFTIAPGSTATVTNAFTFQTDFSTDVITDLTISHQNASSTSLIEIVSSDGTTVYGSVSNPTGTSSVITLSTSTLTANTSETTYKIRVTPKSQAELPSGTQGSLILVSTTVLNWTSLNTAVGTDTSYVVIIDNQSLPSFGITGSSSFAGKVDYVTGQTSFTAASADFNHDGYDDIATANADSNTVSVFINTGDGTFAARVDYAAGSAPVTVVTADVNNDGYVDMTVTNEISDTISVFLNTGDGTFAPKVDSVAGDQPWVNAIADFNNDGYQDITVTNKTADTISVFINTGDGTFASKVDYVTGDSPNFVTAADFDKDGFVDMAVLI